MVLRWLALRSEFKDSTLTQDTEAHSLPTCAPTVPVSSVTPHVSGTDLGVMEWCEGADDWGEAVKEESGVKQERQPASQVESFHDLIDKSNFSSIDIETSIGATAKDIVQNEGIIPNACLTEQITSLQLSDVAIKQEHNTYSPSSFSGPHFKPLYLNVLNEPSGHDDLDKAKELLVKYRDENSGNDIFDVVVPSHSDVKKTNSHNSKVKHCSNQCSGLEIYEKTVAKHGDRTFHKFQKTLARCPEQVLR